MLTLKGYISYFIFQRAFTSKLFKDFVKHQVLPNCMLYSGPRSIIVLDNASIYKSAQLQELCEQAGVILKFLPPYLPDFNPIETTFKDLKAWIRKNYTLMSKFKSFNRFLEFAISQACGVHTKTHFKKAGYIIN